MEYRHLGKSGLKVSEIAYGNWITHGSQVTEEAARDCVRAALDAVGDPCREILDRFFCRDESYRTIGDALALPAGTIASRISRCLDKLRSEIEGRQ